METISAQKMDTGLGIKGLVIKGEQILVLRKPNGKLDLPGGRVERGESPEESLEREIYEELGRVRVRILSPVATWSFIKNSGLLVKGQTWACSYLGGRIYLSSEHVGFIWMRGYQLRTLSIPSIRLNGNRNLDQFGPSQSGRAYLPRPFPAISFKGGGEFCLYRLVRTTSLIEIGLLPFLPRTALRAKGSGEMLPKRAN